MIDDLIRLWPAVLPPLGALALLVSIVIVTSHPAASRMGGAS